MLTGLPDSKIEDFKLEKSWNEWSRKFELGKPRSLKLHKCEL